jgi:hypothetical protein
MARLDPASSGWPEETGTLLNERCPSGVLSGAGLGQSVASFLHVRQPPHARLSLLCAAARLGVPVTVTSALALTSFTCTPPHRAKPSGAGSLRDFRYFTSFVANLERGVYPELRVGGVAAGSLPESGLAGSQSRSLARRLDRRSISTSCGSTGPKPTSSAVRSPGTGKGYSITGHHELLIPLLAGALLS